MKLSNKGLVSPEWKEKGYKLFDYDREALKKNTHDNPVWVHFGAGNIFRGFPARLQQMIIEKGLSDKGIVVGEGFDSSLHLLVLLKKVQGSEYSSVSGKFPHFRYVLRKFLLAELPQVGLSEKFRHLLHL